MLSEKSPPTPLRRDWLLLSDSVSEAGSNESDFGSSLRRGEPVPLTQPEIIALLCQYAGAGFILKILVSLSSPVLQNYFQLEPHQVNEYNAVLSLSWYLRALYGVLSDLLPLFGHYRRPYILLGWFICAITLIIMGLLSNSLPKGPDNSLNPSQALFNVFISAAVLCSVGCVMIIVNCDALTVHYAQLERVCDRGIMQIMTFVVREIFGALGQSFIYLFMDSDKYGGSFSFSINPLTLYFLMLFPTAFCALTTATAMKIPMTCAEPRKDYFQRTWKLCKLRVVWQIGIFELLHSVFLAFDSSVALILQKELGIDQMSKEAFAVGEGVLRAFSMICICYYALNIDWRRAVQILTFISMVCDACFKFIVLWDVNRNTYIYLFGQMVIGMPLAGIYVYTVLCIVEVLECGNEGLMFSTILISKDISKPIADFAMKYIDGLVYSNSLDASLHDTMAYRSKAAISLALAYLMKLISLVLLVLLPRGKFHVAHLKHCGEYCGIGGITFLTLYMGSLLFVIFITFTGFLH